MSRTERSGKGSSRQPERQLPERHPPRDRHGTRIEDTGGDIRSELTRSAKTADSLGHQYTSLHELQVNICLLDRHRLPLELQAPMKAIMHLQEDVHLVRSTLLASQTPRRLMVLAKSPEAMTDLGNSRQRRASGLLKPVNFQT